MIYFFTFGTEGQPYHGGWTVVDAPDKDTALKLFMGLHPSDDGVPPFCDVYTEAEFKKKSMYAKGNYGHRAWEKIKYWRIEE